MRFRNVSNVGMLSKPNSNKHIVALLAVRNEAFYLERCLEHLFAQGIETYIIDNESTDDTIEIAKKYIGRGVFHIETQPFLGFFDWANLLSHKEQLSQKIDADWFIHVDADEIREAPAPFRTLYEGIMKVDGEGYNAINFDEFVFLPTTDGESFEGTDYIKKMKYYYFFNPGFFRRVNAWKNIGQKVDLVSSGGHRVEFRGIKIYPQNFILRHYIALSRGHIISKYGTERIYSQEEVEKRGWHGQRAGFNAALLQLPDKRQLKMLANNNAWDRSVPWKKHTFWGT